MAEQPPPFDLLVLGAGIGGLTAAWKQATAGRRVAVADCRPEPGGSIRTEKVRGYLLERGPNSYTSFGAEEDGLVRAIGLAGRVLRRPLREKERFVWHSGKLHRVPMGLGEFLTSSVLPFRAKLRIAGGMLKAYTPPSDDTELGPFLRRQLGDPMVDTLLRPFFGGVYAADVDKASFAACLPSVWERVQGTNRLIKLPFAKPKSGANGKQHRTKAPRAPKALTSYPDGLIELPRALQRAIMEAGGTVRLGEQLALRRDEAGFVLRLASGDELRAPQAVLATSLEGAARLLEDVAPEAARLMTGLPAVDLNVIHVGVRRAELGEQRDGFGFLTRRGEDVRLLGSIWSSRIFPGRAPEGMDLLTCFYGGDLDPEALEWDDDRTREELCRDLRTTMRWDGGEFDLFEVTRWRPALPLFRVGHNEQLAAIRKDLPPGLHLLANYLGKPSVPDRMRAGLEIAP